MPGTRKDAAFLAAAALALFCLLPAVSSARPIDGFNDGELPSAMELIRGNLEANGGLQNLEGLQSVLATGRVYRSGAPEQVFKVYRKRPNRMKYVGEMSDGTVTMVFDGERAWRTIDGSDGRSGTVEITGPELEEVRRSSIFEDPVLRHRFEPEKIRPVAFEEVDGKATVRVELVDSVAGDYADVWISAEHFQPVKMRRVVTPAKEGAKEFMEEVFLRDYEKVKGVYVARRIEEWRDGEMVKEMKIESIRPNVGIFDSFFSKP
jgi:hypothetical protein